MDCPRLARTPAAIITHSVFIELIPQQYHPLVPLHLRLLLLLLLRSNSLTSTIYPTNELWPTSFLAQISKAGNDPSSSRLFGQRKCLHNLSNGYKLNIL